MLDLVRCERVAVRLVNHAHEPIAVYWRGVELESLPSGAHGGSGMGTRTLPIIAPGDLLTAATMTLLPR